MALFTGPDHIILGLPQEVLEAIFLHLQPQSFLRFCYLTRHFWQTQHRNPTYWRVKTSTTFRIPISPLLHAEGDRWYWLFKKLHTQTRAFVWGQGKDDALGLPFVPNMHKHRSNGPPQAEEIPDRSNRSWPSKMKVPDEVGIIADLQCGGWSTTILSSQGRLFSVGILDYRDGRRVGRQFDKLTRLQYPSLSPIKSFSAGRTHILAVDEAGFAWSWNCIDLPGRRIHDGCPIKASRVVAGWTVSSAHTGEGILYWQVPTCPINIRADVAATEDQHGSQAAGDSKTHLNAFVTTIVVPETHARSEVEQREDGEGVGELLSYVVLEAYVVWITDRAKVLACKIVQTGEPEEIPFEIPAYSAPQRQLKDIHGAFRSFSVFTDTGEVLSGDQTYLDQLYNMRKVPVEHNIHSLIPEAMDIPRPGDIAALQHTGVVSIAYGDHHFHALRASGQILSYGREPGRCGALGLGGTASGLQYRGVNFDRVRAYGDAKALPIVYNKGRHVWFSDSQKAWLASLEAATPNPLPATHDEHALLVFFLDDYRQAAYSEWVEQEGRAWEEGVIGEDGLPSYFATSVAAAGWHSAALVLENGDMADAVRKKWKDHEGKYIWENAPLPRIRLPDGSEIPGSWSLRKWRGGMPTPEDFTD